MSILQKIKTTNLYYVEVIEDLLENNPTDSSEIIDWCKAVCQYLKISADAVNECDKAIDLFYKTMMKLP